MSLRYLSKDIWRMNKGKIVEGIFGELKSVFYSERFLIFHKAVNKPGGISSAQVLRDLQETFSSSKLFAPWLELEHHVRAREPKSQRRRRRNKQIQVKIGHGGTLDPLATGVLITGIGRGTKFLQNFLKCTKDYEAILLFGTSTDTYDRLGKVLRRAPYEHITKEAVQKALEQFRGKFMQLPPLFSAIKMNGKPLYEYAREGKEIPRNIEKRPTEVLELELVEWMDGGTHPYKAPSDEAGYAEINVANQIWSQHNAFPDNKLETSNLNAIDESLIVDQTLSNDEVESKLEGNEFDNSDLLSIKPNSHQEASDFCSHGEKRCRPDYSESTASSDLPPLKKPQIDVSNSTKETSSIIDLPCKPHKSDETKLDCGDQNRVSSGPPAARLRMSVASGFYVRSLCHDLGVVLGSAGLMAELKRTRQGDYQVGQNTLEYEDLNNGEETWGPKVEHWLDKWQEQHPAPLMSHVDPARKEKSCAGSPEDNQHCDKEEVMD